MKDYYKINEIARLYGIGPDSLRYYERLGLLSPRRDTNGYRLYNLKDMYKLTVIRDLRKLDFSMAQIREILEGQCLDNTLIQLRRVDNTLIQLRREQALLEEKLQENYLDLAVLSPLPLAGTVAARRWYKPCRPSCPCRPSSADG